MSARRSWIALLAAFLLLVPLALRAHVHAGHPGADCAVCVVSHHTPTVRTSTPSLATPTVLTAMLAAASLAEPVIAERPVHAGRGPPALLSTSAP